MKNSEKTKITNQVGASIAWLSGLIFIFTSVPASWQLIVGILLVTIGAWYNALWANE